jgi:hypothetical protein
MLTTSQKQTLLVILKREITSIHDVINLTKHTNTKIYGYCIKDSVNGHRAFEMYNDNRNLIRRKKKELAFKAKIAKTLKEEIRKPIRSRVGR